MKQTVKKIRQPGGTAVKHADEGQFHTRKKKKKKSFAPEMACHYAARHDGKPSGDRTMVGHHSCRGHITPQFQFHPGHDNSVDIIEDMKWYHEKRS